MESANVVVAREDQARPFYFAPVKLLKGVLPSEPMPNFVDSTTRRRLASNPEHAVVLAQTRPGDPWTRLAYLDEQSGPPILSIVEQADAWAGDASGINRFRFFAALHDHPDRDVRRMALSELDRAPYGLLRSMEVRVPARALRAALVDPNQAPWIPVRILLLGVLGDAESRVAVQSAVEAAARHGLSFHLGPWAAAAIEIDGASAIDQLSELFLHAPTSSREQRVAVLTAFAVHASHGDRELKPVIDSAVANLIAERPGLASATSRIFDAQSLTVDNSPRPDLERTLTGYRAATSPVSKPQIGIR